MSYKAVAGHSLLSLDGFAQGGLVEGPIMPMLTHPCVHVLPDRDAALELHDAAETILAARLRQRVANRIAESREKELIPPKAPAIDLIRGVARELELAGHALEEAARSLLNITGQGRQAKAAHLAGQRAKDAAEGLTGA